MEGGAIQKGGTLLSDLGIITSSRLIRPGTLSSVKVVTLQLVVRPGALVAPHSKVLTGGRSRERREEEEEEEEEEERKGEEGVPSYDTSVQGHTKRKEGFPAMTKARRERKGRRKERKGKERKRTGAPSQAGKVG